MYGKETSSRPFAAACLMIAHAAVESRPIVEPSGVEGIELLVKHREEAAEMGVLAGRVRVDLDCRILRLNDAPDLQPTLQPIG